MQDLPLFIPYCLPDLHFTVEILIRHSCEQLIERKIRLHCPLNRQFSISQPHINRDVLGEPGLLGK